MDEYRRGELTFDVIDEGPADGTPVVLLHGFPQFNTSWNAVMARLTDRGFRCLAPNQRGYSPRARPRRRRDYASEQLIGDVVALLDAAGLQKVHLVGHDWGAAVAWGVAAVAPERLATLTALSVPHPAAFFRALTTSRQALASWYMYFFQLPGVPEWALNRGAGSGFTRMMADHAGQSAHAAARDYAQMAHSGALTGALNWYRAMPFNKPGLIRTQITVPTLYVWSDADKALLEKGARSSGRHVAAEYRFEILRGHSHWLPDECPDRIADLLLDWFGAHPISG